ncbi:MAG: GDSL-type esterase/lipase family protein, partial [Verrucomicrobiota bacterium]
PSRQLQVRNLAWQADTVYRQQRPLYFYDLKNRDKQAGSTHDQRKRVKPGLIFARFGKMESLNGKEALPEFRKAYGALLDEMIKLTPRVVVVSPTPFFAKGPAAALTEERNIVLAAYCLAMSELAQERGLHFANFNQLEPNRPYSENGVHLNSAGQAETAKRLIQQLNDQGPETEFEGPKVEKLRQAVIVKNYVWHQYHRPTNWAFLYGDRQHVPSSRDHEDGEKRWFPFELERALNLIEKQEAKIYELAK